MKRRSGFGQVPGPLLLFLFDKYNDLLMTRQGVRVLALCFF